MQPSVLLRLVLFALLCCDSAWGFLQGGLQRGAREAASRQAKSLAHLQVKADSLRNPTKTKRQCPSMLPNGNCACPSGTTYCSNVADCIDVMGTDSDNCGECGLQCPNNQLCLGGECVCDPSCGTGEICSIGQCVLCDTDNGFIECLGECVHVTNGIIGLYYTATNVQVGYLGASAPTTESDAVVVTVNMCSAVQNIPAAGPGGSFLEVSANYDWAKLPNGAEGFLTISQPAVGPTDPEAGPLNSMVTWYETGIWTLNADFTITGQWYYSDGTSTPMYVTWGGPGATPPINVVDDITLLPMLHLYEIYLLFQPT